MPPATICFPGTTSPPLILESLDNLTLDDLRALIFSLDVPSGGELFVETEGGESKWLDTEEAFFYLSQDFAAPPTTTTNTVVYIYYMAVLPPWPEITPPLAPDTPLDTVLSQLSLDPSSPLIPLTRRLRGIALHAFVSFRDNNVRAKALKTMPVARLIREALAVVTADGLLAPPPSDSTSRAGVERSTAPLALTFRMALLRGVMGWFRHTFFSWVNSPSCALCGKGTTGKGACEPLPQERSNGGAGQVELYQCTDNECGMETRFPRYTLPLKLFDTRRGRCGEFANCFVACLLSLGYRARHVTDFSDHVWAEVYMEGRWLHADPCEVALDRPYLYETGWGKALTWIFAAGVGEFRDVTQRYTKKWAEVKERREVEVGVDPSHLKAIVAAICQGVRLRGGKSMRLSEEEDEEVKREEEELHLSSSGADDGVRNPEELMGRVTGSEDWKRARGELGENKGGGGGEK